MRIAFVAAVILGSGLVLLPHRRVAAEQFSVGPGEEILVDLSGPDQNDTGIRLKNLSQETGMVDVEFQNIPPQQSDEEVQPGFELVDGTLIVTSNLPPGELRARYRMEYRVRALRRAGLREDSVRMMRLDVRAGTWQRAVRAVRERADVRRLRERRFDFTLGHHGYTSTGRYVWAVLDVNSRYAVGARTVSAVPVLPPLLLGVSGALLLGLGIRRLLARG